jgi:hypothetical protein
VKRSFDDHITVDWRQQRHRRKRRRKLDPYLESKTAHAKTSMKAVCCRLQLASRDLGETLAHLADIASRRLPLRNELRRALPSVT